MTCLKGALGALATSLLLATAAPLPAAPPPTPGSAVTDPQVVASMKQAITYLLDHKTAPDNWETGHNAHSDGGKTALVLYALLHAGQSLEDDDISKKLKPRSPELAPVVKYLADFNADATYPVALQATPWCSASQRPPTSPRPSTATATTSSTPWASPAATTTRPSTTAASATSIPPPSNASNRSRSKPSRPRPATTALP